MGGQGDRHSAISPHLLVPLSPFPLRASVSPWLFSCMQEIVTLTSLGNEPSREGTYKTLVFALALCYTGLRTMVGYPYADVMAILNQPGY